MLIFSSLSVWVNGEEPCCGILPKGSVKEFTQALNKRGLQLHGNSVKGFSDKNFKEQIEYILDYLKIPDYVYSKYEGYNDRVLFEPLEFYGNEIIVSNFIAGIDIQPVWGLVKRAGEIVNYGNQIYAIKLPRIKTDFYFVYPTNVGEYEYFSRGRYGNVKFDNGQFLYSIEFPPIFILKGLENAVEFLLIFLAANRFDYEEVSLDWFPNDYEKKTFYI